MVWRKIVLKWHLEYSIPAGKTRCWQTSQLIVGGGGRFCIGLNLGTHSKALYMYIVDRMWIVFLLYNVWCLEGFDDFPNIYPMLAGLELSTCNMRHLTISCILQEHCRLNNSDNLFLQIPLRDWSKHSDSHHCQSQSNCGWTLNTTPLHLLYMDSGYRGGRSIFFHQTHTFRDRRVFFRCIQASTYGVWKALAHMFQGHC